MQNVLVPVFGLCLNCAPAFRVAPASPVLQVTATRSCSGHRGGKGGRTSLSLCRITQAFWGGGQSCSLCRGDARPDLGESTAGASPEVPSIPRECRDSAKDRASLTPSGSPQGASPPHLNPAHPYGGLDVPLCQLALLPPQLPGVTGDLSCWGRATGHSSPTIPRPPAPSQHI